MRNPETHLKDPCIPSENKTSFSEAGRKFVAPLITFATLGTAPSDQEGTPGPQVFPGEEDKRLDHAYNILISQRCGGTT